MDTHVTQSQVLVLSPCGLRVTEMLTCHSGLENCQCLLPQTARNSRVRQPLKAGMTALQNVTGKNPLFGIIIKMKAERDFVTFILRGLCSHVPRKLTFLRESALQIPLKKKSFFFFFPRDGKSWFGMANKCSEKN